MTYAAVEHRRAEIDSLAGPVVLEFGNDWCGYCRAAQPLIAVAMQQHPAVRHIKVADGPGRRLGRSFAIKLWPTLIFLHNGQEKSRLVRPATSTDISRALAEIDLTGS